MDGERPFRIALAVIFTAFTVIRVHFGRSAGHVRHPEGKRTGVDASIAAALLSFLIPFEVVTLFAYLFLTRWVMWAALPMPAWVRWIGAGLGVLALLLFAWVHRSLGANFSNSVHVREGHTLVTGGPYRWARHPMYTAFHLIHAAAFLLTANWFIGLTWIGGLTVVIALRLREEERVMIETFGELYLAYMKRTRRFL